MIKKAIFIGACLCAVMAHAQQSVSDKNAMVLRVGSMKMTDPKLLQIRATQLSEGKTIMDDNIKLFEQILDEKLRAAVGESKRFEITDSAYAAKLDAEMQSATALNVGDDKMAESMRKKASDAIFAVDWTLHCNITQCQLLRKGNYGWICTVHITPVIQDRRSETLRTVDSRPFVNNVKDTKIRPTVDAAFMAALDAMHNDLVKYFSENFPVYGKIMRLDEKNNAVVNCGLKYNLKDGDVFQVTHVIPQKNSEGKLFYTESVIGTLKVKQVLDESSVCDLSSGKEKIMEANALGGFLQCKQIMK